MPANEEKLAALLLSLDGVVPKFPDNEIRFKNIVRAMAEFVSTDPIPMDGGEIIPAEWLVSQIRDRCDWWPSLRQIRKIYTMRFKPEDGQELQTALIERKGGDVQD